MLKRRDREDLDMQQQARVEKTTHIHGARLGSLGGPLPRLAQFPALLLSRCKAQAHKARMTTCTARPSMQMVQEGGFASPIEIKGRLKAGKALAASVACPASAFAVVGGRK